MVTQTQIQKASELNHDIAEVNEQLRQLIQTIISLKVAGVDISTDTTLINALQSQYSSLKTSLTNFVSQLP